MSTYMNPEAQLNARYKVKDLTYTATGLPNLPIEGSGEAKNLKWLADNLALLEEEIGPFTILSGYRTAEVHNKIKGLSTFPPARPKSFHEAGMAADIHPTTMRPDEFFGKILAGEWKDKLGEIYNKPPQNAIHISLPTDKYRGVAAVMDSSMNYVKLTAEEVMDWAKPYLQQALATFQDITTSVSPRGERRINTWVYVTGGVFSLGLLWLLWPKRK